jgi:hypothetical protein
MPSLSHRSLLGVIEAAYGPACRPFVSRHFSRVAARPSSVSSALQGTGSGQLGVAGRGDVEAAWLVVHGSGAAVPELARKVSHCEVRLYELG